MLAWSLRAFVVIVFFLFSVSIKGTWNQSLVFPPAGAFALVTLTRCPPQLFPRGCLSAECHAVGAGQRQWLEDSL